MTIRRPRKEPKKKSEYVEEAVSAIAASVPFGGGLSVYLDKYYPSYVKATLEDLKACLFEYADHIESITCDQEHLAALLSRLPAEYIKAYSQAKRRALVNVVSNFCGAPQSEAADADVFLHLASSLCEQQIVIIQNLGKDIAAKKRAGSARTVGDTIVMCNDLFPALSRPAVLFLCTDLRQKGLLEPFETNLDATDSPIYLSYLMLTEFGEEFLSWISSPGDSSAAGGSLAKGE